MNTRDFSRVCVWWNSPFLTLTLSYFVCVSEVLPITLFYPICSPRSLLLFCALPILGGLDRERERERESWEVDSPALVAGRFRALAISFAAGVGAGGGFGFSGIQSRFSRNDAVGDLLRTPHGK